MLRGASLLVLCALAPAVLPAKYLPKWKKQLSRVNSPVADLHYMIFNCTDYETREMHFRNWIDYYHSELGKCLSKFGLILDAVYPRKQLDDDMKRYAKLFLALGILIATSLSRDVAKIAELKGSVETQAIDAVFETARVLAMDKQALTLYKQRVKGLVDSYISFGLL